MKTILRLVLLGVLLVPCAVLWAQAVGSGTISGTITDANNATLPDVSVRILNSDTGIERTVTTAGSGDYRADVLQPGHYEVIAAKDGFATVDRKNITLLVGQILGVDLSMPLQSVESTVTVSSASPILDTEKTEASQVVGQELVSNLPVNGRRYDNFVLLTPNVAPDGNSGLISYRGVSGIYNTNLVDGANNNQAFFSEARGRAIGAPYIYSQDSISEFQSETSAYSAEFGQAVGGQINAITKSGTNQMHGDLFYYLRYPSLNALDPVGKTQGIFTQPVHQQQQFGGSGGGPLIKDKLFYFFTYDGFRKVNPILYTSTLDAGTLESYANAQNCPAGVSIQQCTAAVNYLSSLRGAYSRNIKQDIFFPRIDWQINGKNHVSANFNFANFNEPNGYNTSPTATNGSVTQNGTANFHDRILIANWDSVLSSHSVNQVRFQWSRDLETFDANAAGPSVTITGVSAYGMPNALPRPAFPDEHRWEVADIYSTTRGKHTLKAGVDLNFIHELLINLFQGGGIYSYSAGSPLSSFQNWVQDVYGLNGAKHYTNFTQVDDPITHVGKDDFWNKDLAVFGQDSWKITPTFLVNAGVRYDVQLVPQPQIPNTSSDLANYYTKTINIDYHEFQPRVGFSWQPLPTTVLRGGYGLVYGLTSNSTYYTIRVENGVFQQQYNFSPTTAAAPAAPNVLFLPPGPALAAPFTGAATSQVTDTNPSPQLLSARGLDPHFLNPYSHSFSLAVQQQMPFHSSLTVGWVGNRAMRLPIFIDTNLQPATTTNTYDVVNVNGQTQSTVTLPFYTQRITPNTSSILTGFSSVNSWYNSMAVSIEKPFEHGLELLVNYTWAKAIDGAQVSGTNGTFNGTDTPLDPFNLKAEYARSDLDMRNRFVGSLVYAPTFNIASRPFSLLANGWSFSGTATEQTGFPVTANMSNYPTSPVGDGGLTGGELSLFNSGTAGRAPQVGRNAFPGPGLRNIDFRVARSVPIHENIHMEFFAEAFNLLNQQNRLVVNTTAFSYSAPTAPSSKTPNPVCDAASHTNACIYPSIATGGTPFQATTSTSSLLYGPRQLQVSARLFF
jgi:outer membrane receptor protein involved in Fe transport